MSAGVQCGPACIRSACPQIRDILGAECGEAGDFPEGNDVWALASRFFSLNHPFTWRHPAVIPEAEAEQSAAVAEVALAYAETAWERLFGR